MENYLKKINRYIENQIWEKKHEKIQKYYRERYHGQNPTIISCNCIGGILYHELNLQFLSPTINLYMNCEDFVKFCEKLEYYLTLEIQPYCGEIERDYPLGMLGDLLIYFVHYKTLEEAKEKWNIRKKRINWENIYIIATDRDGFTGELLQRFCELPYKNKKIFTHLPYEDKKNTFYIKGYEDENQIEGLMYKIKGGKYLIDQFDWVEWISNN